MEQILDVEGKSLGRAASEAAVILRGKGDPHFAPNIVPDIKLKILNVSQLNIRESKKEGKFYKRYSGYPSGLKETRMKEVWEKDSREVFKRAVWGMLPKNKLRSRFIKNLVIETGKKEE